MQEIDLPPHKWQSDRPKKREPIFGGGALPFVGELIGVAFTFCLLIGIVYLGSQFKGMLFGEKAEKPAISEGVTSNGVHWKVTQ